MNSRARGAAAAGALALASFGSLCVVQRSQDRTRQSLEARSNSAPERAAARAQAHQIQDMLTDLKTKTLTEKLQAAHDGATRTHEIGFPAPRRRRSGADSGQDHG